MQLNTLSSTRSHAAQRGLTLVELMIALAIGMLLVVAMSAVFVNSSTSRREVELSADVIENGRYAIDVLNRDLSQAGFYGSLASTTGTAKSWCSVDVAAWADSLAVHVEGLNNNALDPACLERKAGTDAIFVQRASTCTVGEAGCEAEDPNYAYLQVSECGTEYTGLAVPFVIAKGGSGAATFKLQSNACGGAKAPKRKLLRRIYYVSTNDVLSYVDIALDGAQAPVQLVEGIEQMQLEYAVDTNGDGTADSFTAAPANWTDVIGARLWLLAKSSTKSKNTKNAITFDMGDTSQVEAAQSSNFKRRVYNSYITFVTPKMRRES